MLCRLPHAFATSQNLNPLILPPKGHTMHVCSSAPPDKWLHDVACNGCSMQTVKQLLCTSGRVQCYGPFRGLVGWASGRAMCRQRRATPRTKSRRPSTCTSPLMRPARTSTSAASGATFSTMLPLALKILSELRQIPCMLVGSRQECSCDLLVTI